jgi:hypothetical protein
VEQPEINDKVWHKTMKAIHELLGSVLGEAGIPLVYVICEDEDVPNDAVNPSTNHVTLMEELFSRMPHGTTTSKTYSNNVLEYMTNIGHQKDFWTSIKPAQRAKDGHRGYLVLHVHYLCPDNVNTMDNAAEGKLKSTTIPIEDCGI